MVAHRDRLYGQYCPVARAAEIVADRWTVLILRELLAVFLDFDVDPHDLEDLHAEVARALRFLAEQSENEGDD